MAILQVLVMLVVYVGRIWWDSYPPETKQGPFHTSVYLVEGYACLVGPGIITEDIELWCRVEGATDIILVH